MFRLEVWGCKFRIWVWRLAFDVLGFGVSGLGFMVRGGGFRESRVKGCVGVRVFG